MEELTNELKRLKTILLKSQHLKSSVEERVKNGELNKDKLKALLKNDANIFDISTAKYLLDDHILTRADFIACGLHAEFLDLLYEDVPIDPSRGSDYREISAIAPGVTEVYFWGMPASGKTCALGAIMSMAKNGGDVMYRYQCQGGDYMSRLSQVFRYNGIFTFLPKANDTTHTYEMRFSVTRNKKEHPLALIDMSGELFMDLYNDYKHEPLDEVHQKTFDTLKNILVNNVSENRKIHFFVIEYGAHANLFNGQAQDEYLQTAVECLNNYGVFKEYTDAIYIILTKSDKAPAFMDIEDERNHFRNYMSDKYSNFYWTLQRICEKNSINAGVLEFVPFSIGEVAFKKLCRFDADSAREILDYIIERSFYVEKNVFGKVVRILSK